LTCGVIGNTSDFGSEVSEFESQQVNKLYIMRKGNKQNAFLNGEWAAHMRKWGKFMTAKIRRNVDKKVIREEIKNAQ
jgi:hypothetical protein